MVCKFNWSQGHIKPFQQVAGASQNTQQEELGTEMTKQGQETRQITMFEAMIWPRVEVAARHLFQRSV